MLSASHGTWALQPTARPCPAPLCHGPSQAWQNGFPMQVPWSGSGQPGLLRTLPKIYLGAGWITAGVCLMGTFIWMCFYLRCQRRGEAGYAK